MNTSINTLLLVTEDEQLSPVARIWGTGGWVPPDEREALDWFTLTKLSGWRPCLAKPEVVSLRDAACHTKQWAVFACDPKVLDAALVKELTTILKSAPLVVIIRGGDADLAISSLSGASLTGEVIEGKRICWTGRSSAEYECSKSCNAWKLALTQDSKPLIILDGSPVVSVRRVGCGSIVTLGFHHSAARDDNGIMTRLLRQTLVECSGLPVSWLDFSGTMILRMDDPGAAQNAYLSHWAYPELDYAHWQEIGRILIEKNARLSVGYCTGWVDDGNPARGTLTVRGKAIRRTPGRVYASPEVVYKDENGVRPGTYHDYAGEYRALSELCSTGVIDMELHGYTHMHPDYSQWAKSADRYDAVYWYREFGSTTTQILAALAKDQHPLKLGAMSIERYFSHRPTTLIFPGDECTNEALEYAIDLGVRLVSSYYLALRHEDRLSWITHVCAPYLDEPDRA